jgi:hypothetical protein
LIAASSGVISPPKNHLAKLVAQALGFFGIRALAVSLEHALKALLFVALSIQSGARPEGRFDSC